jgi:hypothetical protein
MDLGILYRLIGGGCAHRHRTDEKPPGTYQQQGVARNDAGQEVNHLWI